MFAKPFVFAAALLLSVSTNAQLLDFRCLSSADGLPAEGVFDLAEDLSGRLLIATEGGGLVRFDGESVEVWNRASHGVPDTLRCVSLPGDNRILLGSAQAGLWQWSEAEAHRIGPPELARAEIRDLLSTGSELYIATLGHGLWRESDEGFRRFYEVPEDVRCLAAIGDTLVAATDEGLFFISDTIASKVAYPPLDQQVLTLFVDNGHTLWAGARAGVFRFKAGVWSPFRTDELAGVRFRAIARDAQGDLWLGAREGVYEWDEDQRILHFYDQTNGLSNNRIRSILHDQFGNLWFGTAFGGVCRLSGTVAMRFSRDQGFPESPVSALTVTPDSSICFGTIDGEVLCWNEAEGLTQVTNENSEVSYLRHESEMLHMGYRSGVSQAQSKAGITTTAHQSGLLKAVGCKAGEYLLYADRIVTPSTEITNLDLACEDFRDLLITKDSLYIAGKCGLFVFPLDEEGLVVLPENTVSIVPRGGRNAFAMTSLISDRQGNIWIGTEQQGVIKYDGSLEALPLRHLNHPKVIAITTDTLENLWVATPGGLNYLELDPSQTFVLSDRQFNADDGLNARVMPHALTSDPTGMLWAGTTRGLFRIDPEGGFHNPTPPVLALTRLDIHFEPLPDTLWRTIDSPEFDHASNHIGFHFKATDLSANQAPHFQCRLNGVEEGWEELGQVSRHYYPGLSPGDYIFELRAQNSSGIWNDPPLQYAFTIDAPFYSEWWFILLAVVASAGLILLLVSIRLRQLERRNRYLQEQVNLRTKELKTEKEESERLLLNILPAETAQELKKQGFAQSRFHREASVLFCDLKGFTRLTEELKPEDLVGLLDQVFRRFDRACDTFGVEKIKTIGDAYMCAAGLPASVKDHASRLTRFALHIQKEMQELNAAREAKSLPIVKLRAGIHSGPLIAGVVGEKKFAYDVWGDTVNIAARMESSGEEEKVNVSRSTYQLIREDFECIYRGKIEAKNKGELEMYFVISERKK